MHMFAFDKIQYKKDQVDVINLKINVTTDIRWNAILIQIREPRKYGTICKGNKNHRTRQESLPR